MKNHQRGIYVILAKGGWWNQRLMKDCGILPYLFHRNYDFRAVLVGYNAKQPQFQYLDTFLKGLEMDFLPDDTLETRIEYINAHAEDIDLLMLYGAYTRYIDLVDCYRKLRPDGKVYLATDANTGWMDRIQYSSDWEKFFNQCDVIAASCRRTQRYLSIKWPVVIDLIPNGWYNFINVNFDNLFERKENIILTVGRIGTQQKNNELLLEAFADCYNKIPNWRVRLVGKIEENFKEYIDKYYTLYPDLKERVEFVGLVEDKIALMEEYKQAKIFAMTSEYEGGTPNVIAEALHAGCYILTSDIEGANDATNEGRCGSIFPLRCKAELVENLERICNNNNLLMEGNIAAFNYAREFFDAEKIVDRLYYLLYNME